MMDIERLCKKLSWSVFSNYTIKGLSRAVHTVDYLIKRGNTSFGLFFTKKEKLPNVYLKSIVFFLDTNIRPIILVTDDINESDLLQYKSYYPNIQIFSSMSQLEDFLIKS